MKKFIPLVLILLLSACDNTQSPLEEKPKVKNFNDMAHLPKLMSIPGKAISVKWQIDETRFNAGNLIALLEFSADDKSRIIKNSQPYDVQTNARLDKEFVDSWIPETARQGIKLKPSGTAYEMEGVVPVKPDLFTQTELSPYVNGHVFPLSGGYVLVLLYSM